jgi:hypothetical protein
MIETQPNPWFRDWIEGARALAEARGLVWEIPLRPDGTAADAEAWNVTAACDAPPIPMWRLNDFGYDAGALRVINEGHAAEGITAVGKSALSNEWQDFIKAGVAWQAFAARNTPSHAVSVVGRAMRLVATCVSLRSGCKPWLSSLDDLQWAISVAAAAQKSGKLRQHVESVIRNIVDRCLLFDNGPFSHSLASFGPEKAAAKPPSPLANLEDRPGKEKLPDAEAFWELADIVFTKEPIGFVDALRFAQIRMLFLCGLRVSEAASIPADWSREKQYLTVDGRPAAAVGGISKSLMLRHFAAKQGADENSSALVEAFQYVPVQFEDAVRSTLDTVREITAPLRERLRRQAETGRHFPEFPDEALVPLVDAYTRLTGNPLVATAIPEQTVQDYRKSLSLDSMAAIREHQARSLRYGSGVASQCQVFWSKWQMRPGAPPLRTADGTPQPSARATGISSLFVRAGDLESWITRKVISKISDTASLALASGERIAAHEFLFLMPKRAVTDSRGGLYDLTRYFSVGRVTPDDLISHLDGRRNGIFARYGDTARSRALSLNTHSLRHAQNTALFSAGLSDAIITKRFNRKSIAQSHVYDHRSLGERLASVTLPAAAIALPDNVRTVAKMIQSGLVKAPIADGFRRIQKEHGDERAFEYLAAEADGFHATPYGHCINGFTQEPCPKHLECFGGCNHFVNTGLDRNVANLTAMVRKLETAVAAIGAMSGGLGKENQLRHAQKHLANLRVILATPEGGRPFPDGPDLSRPIVPETVFDV